MRPLDRSTARERYRMPAPMSAATLARHGRAEARMLIENEIDAGGRLLGRS